MGQTHREYLKEMRAGMPENIRVDFSQPITPEVLGREFSDAWKERYGGELKNRAETLDAHRHEFLRVAETVSKVVMPTFEGLKRSGVFEALEKASQMAKEAAERRERMKSLIAPLAHEVLPIPPLRPVRATPVLDRESEMDALADRVAEKLYAKMMASGAKGPRRRVTVRNVRSQKIETIVLVRPNSGDRYAIVINEAYDQALTVNRRHRAWNVLFRVAEEERIESSSAKSQVDFLSTNRRCRLYTKTGYSLCKILISVGNLVKPGIPMKIIGEKAYRQRLAKMLALTS